MEPQTKHQNTQTRTNNRDYYMLYDILITNKRRSSFDETNWGCAYDALYLLDYKKEEDYKYIYHHQM